MCAAMNNCSGHGTCGSEGKCNCDYLWKGADCSYKAYDVNAEGKFNVQSSGTFWFYLI